MIAIICKQHFNFQRKCIALGGVDTYIHDLSITLASAGYEVRIYQESDVKTIYDYNGVKIVGTGKRSNRGVNKYLLHETDVDASKDILIFSTDYLIVPTPFKNVIAIQHGVAWDITKSSRVTDCANVLSIVKGAIRSTKKYLRYKHCSHLVCVDYNFINWYRTQIAYIGMKLSIIPNYSKIPESLDRKCMDNPKIIFARRLVEYRGTRIFTYALQKVFKVYPTVEITIAGEGPEKCWMMEQLGKNRNVHFISYSPEESLTIHQCHDIAVVPTCGSEGTSLSLLEAMAAGCAVIASNVGGMTNIILDGYNGLMISPDVDELAMALLRLIDDIALRTRIAQKGRETVIESFSFEKWKTKWLQLIEEISKE